MHPLPAPRQPPRGCEQHCPVLGGEFAVEAEEGEFVARGGDARGAFVLAVEEVFERDAEHLGHPQQIAADLAGAVGLPLRDRRARDAEPGGEALQSSFCGIFSRGS